MVSPKLRSSITQEDMCTSFQKTYICVRILVLCSHSEYSDTFHMHKQAIKQS